MPKGPPCLHRALIATNRSYHPCSANLLTEDGLGKNATGVMSYPSHAQVITGQEKPFSNRFLSQALLVARLPRILTEVTFHGKH
jgi:hypothetical protein